MGSILVDVRSLVVAGLTALPAFSGVETTFGYKVGSKRRERVWTQNARFTHAPASLRAAKTFRDESGTFDLVILIEGIGLTIAQASTRAMVLGHVAEDWAATHANWQGAVTGLNWLQIEGDGALAEAFNDKASIAELTFPFAYRARLT